jgi:hypothetical protein
MLQNAEIASILKDILQKDFEGKPTKMANALKVTYNHLKQYLDGKTKPGNVTRQRFLNIGYDLDQIYKDYEEKKIRNALKEDITTYRKVSLPIRLIPVVASINLDANGVDLYLSLEGTMGIPFFEGNYFALVFNSDSLRDATPDGIASGDLLIFDPDRPPTEGDIVAIEIEGYPGKLVRVYHIINKSIIELRAANRGRIIPSITALKEQIISTAVYVGKQTLTTESKKLFRIP